jgi:hypothetical protein
MKYSNAAISQISAKISGYTNSITEDIAMKKLILVLSIFASFAMFGACGAYNEASNIKVNSSPVPTETSSPLDGVELKDIMRIDRYDDSHSLDNAAISYIESSDVEKKLSELKSSLEQPVPQQNTMNGTWRAYTVCLFNGRCITVTFAPQAVALFSDKTTRLPAEDAPRLWMKIKGNGLSTEIKDLYFNIYNETGRTATWAKSPRLEYATDSGWEVVNPRQRAELLWDNLDANPAIVKLDIGNEFPNLMAGIYRLTVEVDIKGETHRIADIFELK